MKKICTVMAAMLLLTGGLTYAGKDIRVGTNMHVDDNIFRNYSDRGDMVFVPYANLGYQHQATDMDNLYFGYSGEFFMFNELSYRDFSVHKFGGDYNHIWPESQTLLAVGAMVETRLNPDDYKYYDYTSGGFYANLKRYLRDNLMLLARYNLSGKKFDEFPEFNYAEQVFSVQTNWYLPSRTTISLTGNYYHKNYTSSVQYVDSLFVEPVAQLSAVAGGTGQTSIMSPGGGMGPPEGRGPGMGRRIGEGGETPGDGTTGGDGVEVITDPDGYYIYGVREDQFESTDQVKLALSVAQNLAEGTGLVFGYEGRINPRNRNRFLANVGESVLNNEELFDDHYSYNGHEGRVQLKQILPDQSSLTFLFSARKRHFSGRPALDLAGYPLPGGGSREDKAALFQVLYSRHFNLGNTMMLDDFQLSAQGGYIKNSSNDAYYDYKSSWFSVSVEKSF